MKTVNDSRRQRYSGVAKERDGGAEPCEAFGESPDTQEMNRLPAIVLSRPCATLSISNKCCSCVYPTEAPRKVWVGCRN